MEKEEFIQKVTPLFIEHGFRTLTVDEICSKFGKSKKTIYGLFHSKKDMIGCSFDYVLKKFGDFYIFAKTKSKTAVEGFFTFMCLANSYFPFDKQRMNLREMQYYYRKLFQEKMNNAQDMAYNLFYTFYSVGREQKLVREDFNIESQSYLFSSLFMDLITSEYINSGENYSITFMDALEISIRGVLTNDGIKVFEGIKAKSLKINYNDVIIENCL